MKEYSKFTSENCVATSSDCVVLQVDLPFLGLCKGDTLSAFAVEVVQKLESIAGTDFSEFDVDSLAEICGNNAPTEVTLLSILNLLKENDICLKDYITTLENKIDELTPSSSITIDLKCYSEFDSLGNALGITREQLDQLVINELCDHEAKITALQGKVTAIEESIQDLEEAQTSGEVNITTCVNPSVKPVSEQVKSVATAHCAHVERVGTLPEISNAISKIPSYWISPAFQAKVQAKFGPNAWILNAADGGPLSLADHFNNFLLAYQLLYSDMQGVLNGCCAVTCDSIEIGFSVVDEGNGDITIRFRPTDGNKIPDGWVDNGSSVYFTDVNGVRYPNTGSVPIDVTKEENEGYTITGLATGSPITITILAKVKAADGSLVCEKCVSKDVTIDSDCPVCQVIAVGGPVTITYQVN